VILDCVAMEPLGSTLDFPIGKHLSNTDCPFGQCDGLI
jgi:hypothetical protein